MRSETMTTPRIDYVRLAISLLRKHFPDFDEDTANPELIRALAIFFQALDS